MRRHRGPPRTARPSPGWRRAATAGPASSTTHSDVANQGMPRLAFVEPSSGSTTTRRSPSPERPLSSDNTANPASTSSADGDARRARRRRRTGRHDGRRTPNRSPRRAGGLARRRRGGARREPDPRGRRRANAQLQIVTYTGGRNCVAGTPPSARNIACVASGVARKRCSRAAVAERRSPFSVLMCHN